MTCQYVNSSNLSQVCYDTSTLTLEVSFRSGGVYHYSNVPQHVYIGLMSASSHGSYFAQYVKNRYPTTKLR